MSMETQEVGYVKQLNFKNLQKLKLKKLFELIDRKSS